MRQLKPSMLLFLATAATQLAAQEGLPPTAHQQAKALIGGEYVGMRIEALQSSCTEEGGSSLTEGTKTSHDWSYGNLYCQGKPVLALKKFLGYVGNLPRWRVVDAIVIPAYQHDDLSGGPGTLQFTETGLCTLDGKRDQHIVALVRDWQRPKRNGERVPVLYSWGFDLKREKIVPISTKRVRCVHDEP